MSSYYFHVSLIKESSILIHNNNVIIEISITSDMQMTPPLWQKVKKN